MSKRMIEPFSILDMCPDHLVDQEDRTVQDGATNIKRSSAS
jgi:hypothetical protein